MSLSCSISDSLASDLERGPRDILNGLTILLDPRDVVVTSGKVETWNGQKAITQSDAAKRAAFIASDPNFSGQPSANFQSAIDGEGNLLYGAVYPLGDLSAYTEGEIFVVLKLDSASPSNPVSGGWRLGTGSQDHWGFTNGRIYSSDFSTLRRNLIDPAPVNLASPHIANVSSRTNEWVLRLNGTTILSDATNTVSGNTAAYFGGDNSIYMDGQVAFAAICNRVQTSAARVQMVRYLRARFAV